MYIHLLYIVHHRLNKLAVMEAELKSFKKSSQQLKKEAEKDRKEINSLENTVSLVMLPFCFNHTHSPTHTHTPGGQPGEHFMCQGPGAAQVEDQP